MIYLFLSIIIRITRIFFSLQNRRIKLIFLNVNYIRKKKRNEGDKKINLNNLKFKIIIKQINT